jgi:hypothetical protein
MFRKPSVMKGSVVSFAATCLLATFAGFPASAYSQSINPIAVGKLAWDIVSSNKPNAEVEQHFFSVVPRGAAKDPLSLENFSDLQVSKFTSVNKGAFGMHTWSVDWNLVHQWGGTYKGQGQFLTGVGIVPEEVWVNFGNTLNMKANVISVTNAGTAEDPVAKALIKISNSVSWIGGFKETSQVFEIRGDSAQIQELDFHTLEPLN